MLSVSASPARVQADPWHDPRPWNRLHAPAVDKGALPDGRVKVGNVRWGFQQNGSEQKQDWDPRFFDTTIDVSKVRDVYFTVEPFPGAGHALMVFEFDPAHPIRNSNGETDTRLALSVEARVKRGEKWGALPGLFKRFANIYQLGSFTDQVQKVCRAQGHRLELRRLELTAAQKQGLLRNALEEAFKDRTGEYYHTTRNSCYSAQLRLLNSVLPRSRDVGMFAPLPVKIVRPSAMTPTLAGAALRHNGLLADASDIVIQADPALHPQKEPGRLSKSLRIVSSQAWFKSGMTLLGAVAGAAALFPAAGMVGGVAGLAVGQFLGRWTADHIYTRTHLDYISPQPWLDEVARFQNTPPPVVLTELAHH